MRIGILTQPLHNNYGCLLQNFALQQVLKGMGHDVETVDWEPMKVSALKEWLFFQKMSFLSLLDKNIEKPRYRLSKTEAAVIGRNTGRFIEKYINVCKQKVNRPDELVDIDEKFLYNAYVVGSDQVWRPSYNANMVTAMFLDFVKRKNVKRIAYAASFGTSEWEYPPTMSDECARLAKKFDLVTVREKSGVNLCRCYLGVEAIHVLDPTMLLNKADYELLVNLEREQDSSGTLFHYILDPSPTKKAFIDKFAINQGLIPFTIMPKFQAENRTRKDVKNNIEDCVFPSVTSWLRGFIDSKAVIVDSFHGAVFSIIFNKPFWVLANARRGNARFESLLNLFGLEDRMISTDSLDNDFDWNKKIDWEKVNQIRLKEMERCKSLLIEALNLNICQK